MLGHSMALPIETLLRLNNLPQTNRVVQMLLFQTNFDVWFKHKFRWKPKVYRGNTLVLENITNFPTYPDLYGNWFTNFCFWTHHPAVPFYCAKESQVEQIENGLLARADTIEVAPQQMQGVVAKGDWCCEGCGWEAPKSNSNMIIYFWIMSIWYHLHIKI